MRLTTAADGEEHYPDDFSPDGAWLTYTVQSEEGSSIWILNLDSGDAEPLISQPGVAFSQSIFSPNGGWIAYQSTETGEDEIFVQPFPLTGAKNQLPTTVENHHPVWSADGTELYYFPGPGRFESVEIATEPIFSFSTATVHTNPPMNDGPSVRRRYDVMPDGSGFLGFVSGDDEGGAQGEFRIVYNWFEELKQRVPTD